MLNLKMLFILLHNINHLFEICKGHTLVRNVQNRNAALFFKPMILRCIAANKRNDRTLLCVYVFFPRCAFIFCRCSRRFTIQIYYNQWLLSWLNIDRQRQPILSVFLAKFNTLHFNLKFNGFVKLESENCFANPTRSFFF